MADVHVTYTCGCGFKTRRSEAAIEHSDSEHHSITVLGTIKSTASKVSGKTQTQPQTHAESSFGSPFNVDRIQELRKMLDGG